MITDEQVEAALLKWWDADKLPWAEPPVDESFKKNSMRDMRAALEAAKRLEQKT